MSLFRPEVSDYRKQRLHGEVVLSQPLSTRVLVAAIVVVLTIVALWVSLGTYARVETVPGILSTNQPTTKIVANAPGIVTELLAREGQFIRQGDRLIVVSLDRQVTGGRAVAGRSLDALEAQQGIARQQVGLSRQRAASERVRLMTIIDGARDQIASLND